MKFNDPACGAGALLIEGAEAFIRSGGRQCDLVIYGEDLDSNAFNIAFTQFTLLGYAARVTRMDSIAMKVFEGPWYTIGYFAHGIPMRVGRETPAECNADAEPMTATEGTAKTEELAPPPAAPSVPIAEQTPDAKGGFIQGDLFG